MKQKIEVNCIVMLTKPHFPENYGRIGQVVLPVTIKAHRPVEDHWLVKYPDMIKTTDGPCPYSCSEGWRLTVLAPPGTSLQDVLEAPQPVLEPA